MSGNINFNGWLNDDGSENYKCRAWVNFDGEGTVAIRAAGNVSSITDNGTGNYTVNFTTAMVDANYAVSSKTAGSQNSNSYRSHATPLQYNSTSFQLYVGFSTEVSSSQADYNNVVAVVFR